jgi:CRISPR-associated protein Cas2
VSSTDRSFAHNAYIISYDISDNKLRRKTEKLLKGYGIRMQYSVFRCKLDNAMLQRMLDAIRNTVDRNPSLLSDGDSIVVIRAEEKKINYVLGNDCNRKNYMIC